MERNMAKLPFKGITDAQFLNGLLPRISAHIGEVRTLLGRTHAALL